MDTDSAFFFTQKLIPSYIFKKFWSCFFISNFMLAPPPPLTKKSNGCSLIAVFGLYYMHILCQILTRTVSKAYLNILKYTPLFRFQILDINHTCLCTSASIILQLCKVH